MVVVNTSAIDSILKELKIFLCNNEIEYYISEDIFLEEVENDVFIIDDKLVSDKYHFMRVKRDVVVSSMVQKRGMLKQMLREELLKVLNSYTKKDKIFENKKLFNKKITMVKHTYDVFIKVCEDEHEYNKWYVKEFEKIVTFSETTKEAKRKFMEMSEKTNCNLKKQIMKDITSFFNSCCKTKV